MPTSKCDVKPLKEEFITQVRAEDGTWAGNVQVESSWQVWL